MVSDMANGVREAVHKVADMGREAAGRGLETAKGLYSGGSKTGLSGAQGAGNSGGHGKGVGTAGVQGRGEEGFGKKTREAEASGTSSTPHPPSSVPSPSIPTASPSSSLPLRSPREALKGAAGGAPGGVVHASEVGKASSGFARGEGSESARGGSAAVGDREFAGGHSPRYPSESPPSATTPWPRNVKEALRKAAVGRRDPEGSGAVGSGGSKGSVGAASGGGNSGNDTDIDGTRGGDTGSGVGTGSTSAPASHASAPSSSHPPASPLSSRDASTHSLPFSPENSPYEEVQTPEKDALEREAAANNTRTPAELGGLRMWRESSALGSCFSCRIVLVPL